MKRLVLPLFFLLLFGQSASATMLNLSFSGTGVIYNDSLESYGLFNGNTVTYGGSFLIDTDLMILNNISFYNNIAYQASGSGDFVVSGAIEINNLIFPIMPDRNAYFGLSRGPSNSAIYEPYLAFDVLSPTGDICTQVAWDLFLPFDFSMDYYLANQNDPFLQPLALLQRFTPAVLSNEEGAVGPVVGGDRTVASSNIVQYPPAVPVPEPSTTILFGIGLIGLWAIRKRGYV